MAQIEINCIGQTAIYTNTPEIFSGDVNIDTVKFTFDEAWNGYDMKTAVFYNNPKDTYPVMLDENDVAVIPEAVMADKCKLSIGVFGTNANGDVKTSKILTYNIGKGAISNDLEATTPPEFWEQLLTRQIKFENNIDGRVSTLETDVDTIEAIALGRNQALAYTSYSEMVTALNGMSSDELMRGQNIYIGALGVPDLWVYGVETENVEYTYVDDDTFVGSLNKDVTVQVGYFKLAQLETQKVDVGGIYNDINALQEDMEDITARVIILERGCTIPPRPVTVNCAIIENGTLEIEWIKPNIYDIQLAKYNIYGYIGNTTPTNFNQFTLIGEFANTETSANISVSEEYDYILIASVSTDGAIQKDLSQAIKTAILKDTLTLSDYSWADINAISTYKTAKNYFSVGDTKSLEIDGTSYNVQIYGFNHDTKSDGSGKASITFGLANCLSTLRAIHTSSYNTQGWDGSAIYSYLNSTIFNNKLPEELRNVIKPVDKQTSPGGQNRTIETSSDKLFLFSETEVLGKAQYGYTGEGTQYSVFTTSTIKKQGDSGSAISWWTRSPYIADNNGFVVIGADGKLGQDNANKTKGICFGFCI